jgi:alpha-D-ribose 1-methylphosphonate 5-triphosphate synthase subunit PhnL
MTLLEVRDLSKTFHIHQLGRHVEAFRQVNFDLNPGEFLLVRAPNGAGKSTLLRCLWRSCLPSGGAARFRSASDRWVDLARCAEADVLQLRRSELGFVTQFLRPRPRVSARDIVAEPLLADGFEPRDALKQAADWLDAFGVKPALWNAYPSTFSGGEQQKVNLARALIRPVRLLLLDEPTASLDAGARRALVERLGELKAQGVAMIAVFHHPEDVAHLIDTTLDLAAFGTASGRADEPSETDHVVEQFHRGS